MAAEIVASEFPSKMRKQFHQLGYCTSNNDTCYQRVVNLLVRYHSDEKSFPADLRICYSGRASVGKHCWFTFGEYVYDPWLLKYMLLITRVPEVKEHYSILIDVDEDNNNPTITHPDELTAALDSLDTTQRAIIEKLIDPVNPRRYWNGKAVQDKLNYQWFSAY